ncbi:MAG: hypothetical protein HC905_22025 [Bacteroidales bacterium]|nr:hypothetical protein [Bacteroidales bacterium]
MSETIFQIEGDKMTQIDLGSLNLKSIFSCQFSGNYYFVFGENAVNDKVFVRIDPSTMNSVYTQILAPGEMEIHHFSVSKNNNLLFSGIRKTDAKKLFGYIPFNGNNWIIDDDIGIDDKQLLIR